MGATMADDTDLLGERHPPDIAARRLVAEALDETLFVAAGAGTLVLAAATGVDGYDERPDLDEQGWQRLLTNLDRLAAAATERGIVPTLHPHVGTMIEKPDEVDRVLGGSGIALTLDTGHLMIGGNDVVALAAAKPSPLAPELPLLTRDIPALDINNWFGLVGPAGMPEDIKASLAKMFLDAMADPKNAETLAKQGLEPLGQGPAAFAAYIAKDRQRWAKVVKQGNIKAE